MTIYRQNARVLVQGLTGKQGSFWTEKMLSCGTQVVAGVNPNGRERTISACRSTPRRGRPWPVRPTIGL